MNKGSYNDEIDNLCEMKAWEFTLFGYQDVQKDDIWQCVSESYQGELPPLHRFVNDILSLKPDRWMNWMMMQALKGDMQPFD